MRKIYKDLIRPYVPFTIKHLNKILKYKNLTISKIEPTIEDFYNNIITNLQYNIIIDAGSFVGDYCFRLKNNSIGAIVSAGTFTHGHVGPDVFDELLRITKPGGLFVLSINAKAFLKEGFQKKFLKIKNYISTPKFVKYNAHGNHKDKKFNKIEIFGTIFRKKL